MGAEELQSERIRLRVSQAGDAERVALWRFRSVVLRTVQRSRSPELPFSPELPDGGAVRRVQAGGGEEEDESPDAAGTDALVSAV